MNCKFCNAEMEENHKFCPFCGKDQSAEVISEEQPVEAVAEETPVVETPVVETPKKKVWPLVLGITGAVLGLLALAVALLVALGVDFKAFLPRENNIMAKDTYVVSDEKAAEKGDIVVATMGDKVLTNTQLQIYYRMQVMDILNYYGSYASQIGLDYTQPLSEQTCYYDDTMSWEQYLMEIAIETWQNYQAVALLAEEANFEMGADWKESLEALPEQLKTQAETDGYDSVDALLKKVIGPSCELEDYLQYVELAYLSNAYYLSLEDSLNPTQAEIEAYFTENEATFTSGGITKESGNIADVRHILIAPEGGTTDEETQTTTYSDAEWAACQKAAEDLLNQWKAGDATEDSFAALVADNTDDTGSLTTGGLYEDITPGSNYVEEFLAWAIDPARVVGETGLVKTQFGYHIMYYVSGEPYWSYEAGVQLLAERMTEKTEAAEAKWPMKVNYKKIELSALVLE